MANITTPDTLSDIASSGFSSSWDYKASHVSKFTNGDGMERFSQYSATPDTTMLYAGPARFTGLGNNVANLTSIGLVDGITLSQTPNLQRLFEIGSNRSFFTRGKTISSVTMSKMLADQKNILMALTSNAYSLGSNTNQNSPATANTTPDISMNLDSEYFAVPFGMLMLFKTRGGNSGDGKLLSAVYLEYCMFANYQVSVASSAPVLMDNVAIEFDRVVPVALV